MTTAFFLSDLTRLQDRTRQHSIERPAAAEGVLRLLNDLLASELIWLMRYRRRYLLWAGRPEVSAAPATEEIAPADRLARRIVELGGEPDLDPDHLQSRSRADYAARGSVSEMVREDLRAERIVMESYAEVLRYVGDTDPLTRAMLEDNLNREATREAQLARLLLDLEPAPAHARAG